MNWVPHPLREGIEPKLLSGDLAIVRADVTDTLPMAIDAPALIGPAWSIETSYPAI